jgi:hypothetical protein
MLLPLNRKVLPVFCGDKVSTFSGWRYDNQHNDNQLNDTQHDCTLHKLHSA